MTPTNLRFILSAFLITTTINVSECRFGIFNGDLHMAKTPPSISPSSHYRPVVINYAPRHIHTVLPAGSANRRSSLALGPFSYIGNLLKGFRPTRTGPKTIMRRQGIAGPLIPGTPIGTALGRRIDPAIELCLNQLLTKLLSFLPIEQQIKIRNLIAKGKAELAVKKLRNQIITVPRPVSPLRPALVRPIGTPLRLPL